MIRPDYTPVLAWHFLGPDMRLHFGDNRIVKPGWWYDAHGGVSAQQSIKTTKLCQRGMHGSVDLFDALYYANGASILCRVEIEGDLWCSSDKLVGLRRRVLWHVDAHPALAHALGRSYCDLWHVLINELDRLRGYFDPSGKAAMKLKRVNKRFEAAVWRAANAQWIGAE